MEIERARFQTVVLIGEWSFSRGLSLRWSPVGARDSFHRCSTEIKGHVGGVREVCAVWR